MRAFGSRRRFPASCGRRLRRPRGRDFPPSGVRGDPPRRTSRATPHLQVRRPDPDREPGLADTSDGLRISSFDSPHGLRILHSGTHRPPTAEATGNPRIRADTPSVRSALPGIAALRKERNPRAVKACRRKDPQIRGLNGHRERRPYSSALERASAAGRQCAGSRCRSRFSPAEGDSPLRRPPESKFPMRPDPQRIRQSGFPVRRVVKGPPRYLPACRSAIRMSANRHNRSS